MTFSRLTKRITLFSLLVLVSLGTFALGESPDHDTIQSMKLKEVRSFEKGLYKASLDISIYHLTGFIYLKKTPDSSFRLVFVNQIGMTFFDLEISQDSFKVHQCFPAMQKKSFLKILELDFRTLLFPLDGMRKIDIDHGNEVNTYFDVQTKTGKWIFEVSNQTGQITAITSRGKMVQKTALKIEYTEAIPTSVTIDNLFIKLRIKMEWMPPSD